MNREDLVFCILLLFLGIFLIFLYFKKRKSEGIPSGRVIYDDASSWRKNNEILFSKEYQLAGKPDFLIKKNGKIIPVEVKSMNSPSSPDMAHLMQLTAYCLLIESVEKQKPPYGVLHYRDKSYQISYTESNKKKLLSLMNKMRLDRENERFSPEKKDLWKCRNCSYADICGEKIG